MTKNSWNRSDRRTTAKGKIGGAFCSKEFLLVEFRPRSRVFFLFSFFSLSLSHSCCLSRRSSHEKGREHVLFLSQQSMLRLAALAAARRGGSTRGSRLVVHHAKGSGLATLEESAAATAATAAMASSSSSSSPFFSLSIRSFAARAAPAEGGDDRKAATRNAVLVKVRFFSYGWRIVLFLDGKSIRLYFPLSLSHLSTSTLTLNLFRKKNNRH